MVPTVAIVIWRLCLGQLQQSRFWNSLAERSPRFQAVRYAQWECWATLIIPSTSSISSLQVPLGSFWQTQWRNSFKAKITLAKHFIVISWRQILSKQIKYSRFKVGQRETFTPSIMYRTSPNSFRWLTVQAKFQMLSCYWFPKSNFLQISVIVIYVSAKKIYCVSRYHMYQNIVFQCFVDLCIIVHSKRRSMVTAPRNWTWRSIDPRWNSGMQIGFCRTRRSLNNHIEICNAMPNFLPKIHQVNRDRESLRKNAPRHKG